jgi:hypothetical protein
VHNIEMVRNVERHGDDDQYNNGKLFQLKASNGWSDYSFKDLLTLLSDTLPHGNIVPETVYEVKQIIYSLSLEVKKINACKNDCILYHGPEYEDLEKYHICGLDRFNHRKDNGDNENSNRNRRKCRPKKMF